MNARMGRPTSDPKEIQYRLRMSSNDVAMLEYCCKITGKTKADILRLGLKNVYESLKK